MLVVYSRWVQIVTAKTTRCYITSIVEGWEKIAGQMEIYQTPWFNFMDVPGQQCVLLAAFEATRMQSPNVNVRVPLKDMVPSEQNSKSSKRKLPTAEENGSKREKTKHGKDDSKEAFPM